MLSRLAVWSCRNRWKVVILWLLVLVGVSAISNGVGAIYKDSNELPSSESRDGFDIIEKYFGRGDSGMPGAIVIRSTREVTDPAVKVPLTKFLTEVATYRNLQVSSPYDSPNGAFQISTDKRTAFASLTLNGGATQQQGAAIGKKILAERPKIDGVQIELGGASFAGFEPPQSEAIGVAFAIVILILAFGSVVAMGLPIAVAMAGVGTGIGLVGLLSHLVTMPSFSTTIGAMIGLGVGIDYALFIVTRYREELHRGRSVEDAVAIANDTAGRAVIFAGMTVVVSLLGMLLIGLSFVTGLGVGSAVTVAVTMIASVTLVPAMLGFAGGTIERTRVRGIAAAGLVAIGLLGMGLNIEPLLVCLPLAVVVIIAAFVVPRLRTELPPRRQRAPETTFAHRWSRQVQAHPWISLGVGTAILVTLAVPVAGLRLGFSDEGNFPKDSTTRRAYDLLADGFGPGFNSPILLPIVPKGDATKVAAIAAAVKADPGVAAVIGPIPSDMKNPAASPAYMLRVISKTAPQSEATEKLVNRLRSTVIPPAAGDATTAVTGFVPIGLDFSSYLGERTLLFFGVVLALSFLLLMTVFRSVLVPLKAVVMNVLSIGAAYGIVVAIFQWGWLNSLTGIEPAPIEPFIPMMMFAIVFGLSMDYEVFLLSRVREEYFRTNDAVGSVADGLASTARVISAAAAIMVVVFGAFILEENRVPRVFGLGLAVAVLLDATLVRMLLVPATMELLGHRNWWIPRWLDRILPHLSVEGPSEAATTADA